MSVKCTTCDKSCSFRKEPFHSDYASLLARHAALVEAVKKDRKLALEESGEFETEAEWKAAYSLWVAARAEVDKLLEERK